MKKLLKIKINIIIIIVIFSPSLVLASNVYIDTSHKDFFVGDIIMFNVRVDSENKSINAVEGNVLMDYLTDSVSLIDINTSGSKFSLWPDKPLPSESNTSISFAGGTPLGLNSKDAILFNIVLKLQKAGQITLSPNNLSVYLNDGKGTEDAVSAGNLVIEVLPQSDRRLVDDWSRLVSDDKMPPEPFEIYLGQEGSVFDGKKFLSFSTTDEQSGIAYYEVREGDNPPVRSSDTYVLQEQNGPVQVTVVAYDSAGNTRESIYISASPNYIAYAITFVVIIILIILLFRKVFRKMRKKKNDFTKK